MSEQMKFVVDRLNKQPFSKSFNLISFDALEPFSLLQLLSDVLSEVASQPTVDLREEQPEDTAIRIFSFLRVLKYKPKVDVAQSAFRQGVIQGEKAVVHPILHWVLQRLPELKKRAYLARFLVKIEVPLEILQDEKVQMAFSTYEELLEQFKECHKTAEQMRSSGVSAADIRRDIGNMEDEREQLKRRIERQKRKVTENVARHEHVLKNARELRKERDREAELAEQRLEQKNQLLHLEQKYMRVHQQLRELQAANLGASAEALLQRLDEENKANSYLVKVKLPKDIETCRKSRAGIQQVLSEPAIGQSDLDAIQEQIDAVQEEISQLYNQRLALNKPSDDKLSMFRQQAAVIARKKLAEVEAMDEARQELSAIVEEVQSRKQKMDGVDESDLEPEGMQRLMHEVRSFHDQMKVKRKQLEEVQAENGVLQRTLDLLRQQEEALKQELVALEEEKGVSGFQTTQDRIEKVSSVKSELDEKKGRTLEEISILVGKVNRTLTEKKNVMGPLVKEIRPLRQQCQELTRRHQTQKAEYDSTKAGLESNRSQLEQEVRGLREQCHQEESRFHYLNTMIKVQQIQLERANDELQLYVSSSKDRSEKRQSYRDQFQRRIQEQEHLGKALREKQKAVREAHSGNSRQMRMWQDVARLVECKRQSFLQQEERRRKQAAMEEDILAHEDHLILS